MIGSAGVLLECEKVVEIHQQSTKDGGERGKMLEQKQECIKG